MSDDLDGLRNRARAAGVDVSRRKDSHYCHTIHPGSCTGCLKDRIKELETEVAEERERGDWWRDRTTNLSREINGDLCGWCCEGTIKDGRWACNEHDMIREVKPIDPDWQPAGGLNPADRIEELEADKKYANEMTDDLIERLQCWVNDLDQTDHGWQECSDAITLITELEELLKDAQADTLTLEVTDE